MSDMAQDPVVRLTDGAVRGKAESGVLAFLGIPYAAPPFGVNRMRPPRPVTAWDGERDATASGPTAPMGDYPPLFAPLRGEQNIAVLSRTGANEGVLYVPEVDAGCRLKG